MQSINISLLFLFFLITSNLQAAELIELDTRPGIKQKFILTEQFMKTFREINPWDLQN